MFILECKLVHAFSVPDVFIWINKTTKLQKLIYRVPLYCQFSPIPCSVKILNWRRITDTSWIILAYFQTRVMNHKYSCSEFIHWETLLQQLINNITALASLQRKESNFPSISKCTWRQDQRSPIFLSYPPLVTSAMGNLLQAIFDNKRMWSLWLLSLQKGWRA